MISAAVYDIISRGKLFEIFNGTIDNILIDVASLAVAGTAITGATILSKIEQEKYQLKKGILEARGFIPAIMRNKSARKKARIYAEEAGRLGEYEAALRKY